MIMFLSHVTAVESFYMDFKTLRAILKVPTTNVKFVAVHFAQKQPNYTIITFTVWAKESGTTDALT